MAGTRRPDAQDADSAQTHRLGAQVHMKKYLKYLFTCLSAAVFITASSPTKSSEEWRTDYKKALEQAVVERKKVLLNFTGSDWCRWCIRFKEEVFDRPEFVQFAKKHLVLVRVDFPRSGSLPRRLLEQNERLRKEYRVREFPTFVLLDCNGKKLRERVGYMEGGATEMGRWIHLLPSHCKASGSGRHKIEG